MLGWWVDARAATCGAWADNAPLTDVSGAPFSEASGIAASRTRPGVFFLHGDSGNEPVVAAVDRQGRHVETHRVVDAENDDWEDLAAARCPDEGDCLYIGDIGDNADNVERRPNVTVYVIREPEPGDTKVASIRRYVGVYPDGPHDAEALLVDPCTGRVHVVTKDGERTQAYRFPFDPEDTATLELVADFLVPGPTEDSRQITGADWDVDGDRFVLRGADRLYLYAVDPDAPDSSWALPPEVLVGTTELQGEGVAFGTDGDLYTTGEGRPIPLSVVECTELVPAEDPCAFEQTGRSCGCASAPALPHAGVGLLVVAAVGRRRRR